MSTVDLHIDIAVDNQYVPQESQFSEWIQTALNLAIINPKVTAQEVCIRIVSSEESATLNETYRKKNGPTNVLSFHYHPIPGHEDNSLGDLAICAEVVSNEAHAQKKTLDAHWAHMTIHGILHLLGYDHIQDADAQRMEQLEIDILKSLGYTNPYEN